MKRVLVVDDDLDILEALRFMLEDAGFVVETTPKNGSIVDKKIKDHPPDIILLDVLLSGHDGRHICKKLKSGKNTKDIPIIMISAHPDAKKTSFDAGADDFLGKPFDIGVLLEKIKKNLRP